MQQSIRIPSDEIEQVERLFFDYNTTIEVLKYIMSQSRPTKEGLSSYLTMAADLRWELEHVKAKVSDKYRPDFAVSYAFDFPKKSIVYYDTLQNAEPINSCDEQEEPELR